MAIHGNSADPVYVKKISLRIWKLRDEIESVISEQVDPNDESSKAKLNSLKAEYSSSTSIIVEEENGSEASSEEEANNAETSEESSDIQGEETQVDIGGEVIKQRRPILSKDKVIKGISILGEIRMDELFLFCNQPMMPGQSVVVDFLVPKRFVMNAEVIFCRPFSMKSRVISENKLPYRCAVKFTFRKRGERTLLRQFLESIEPDTEMAGKAAEVSAAAAAADESLGDLDDLDL